jgi:hypothetical protein
MDVKWCMMHAPQGQYPSRIKPYFRPSKNSGQSVQRTCIYVKNAYNVKMGAPGCALSFELLGLQFLVHLQLLRLSG